MLSAIFTRRIMYAVAFALAFGAVCFLLGRWQLSRFDDKDARATAVEQNYHREAVPLASVLPSATTTLAESQVWTRVTVTGRYAVADQLYVRARYREAVAGMEVLVPLHVDGGAVLLVDRGWVANGDEATDIPAVPPAPAGTVTVTGWLKPGEDTRGKVLPRGQLETVNIAAAQAQVSGQLYAAYLVMGSESLGDGQPPPARPTPLETPLPDRGPHLAYALQWWTTALLGAAFVVYLYRHPPGGTEPRAKPTTATAKPKKVRIWDEEDG